MNKPSSDPEDFANAFETAFARLRACLEEACVAADDWPRRTAAALGFAAADPAAAKLLNREALADGDDGIAHHEQLIAYLAEGLARVASNGRVVGVCPTSPSGRWRVVSSR